MSMAILPLTQEEKELRTRIYTALNKFGYKQIEVARETGIHHSTLSLWLAGKVKGKFVKIGETMEQWLTNVYQNQNGQILYNILSFLNFNRRPADYISAYKSLNFQYKQNQHKTHVPIKAAYVQDNYSLYFQEDEGENEIEGEQEEQNHLDNEDFQLKLDKDLNEKPIKRKHFQKYKQKLQELNVKNLKLSQMSKFDNLIPIRFDIEFDQIRQKENIIWNLDEPCLTPEIFAKIYSEENNLTFNFDNEIAQQIKKFMAMHHPFIPVSQELIKVIELEIRIGNVCFKDLFEWDISDPNNKPEQFALQLCQDVGLNSEFVAEISHNIREQIQNYLKEQNIDYKNKMHQIHNNFDNLKKCTRTLFESGIYQYNIQNQIKPAFNTITRENYIRQVHYVNIENTDNLSLWEPKIEILEQSDIKKLQKIEDRKYRVARRVR